MKKVSFAAFLVIFSMMFQSFASAEISYELKPPASTLDYAKHSVDEITSADQDSIDITTAYNSFTGTAIWVTHPDQTAGSQIIKGLGVDLNSVNITIQDISDTLKPYIGVDGKSLKPNDTANNIEGTITVKFDKRFGINKTKIVNVMYIGNSTTASDNADISKSFYEFTSSAISVSYKDQATSSQAINVLGLDSNGVTISIKTIDSNLAPYLGIDGRSLKRNEYDYDIYSNIVIAFNKGSGIEQIKPLSVIYNKNQAYKDIEDIIISSNSYNDLSLCINYQNQKVDSQVIKGLGVNALGVNIIMKDISDSLKPYIGIDGKSLKQNNTGRNINGTVFIAFNKGGDFEITKLANVAYMKNPSPDDNADITASFNAFTGAAISVSTTGQAIGTEVINGLGVDSNGVSVTVKTISDSLIPYIGTDGKSLKQNDSSLNIDGTVVIAFNKGLGTEQTKTLNVTYACNPSNKDNADITASFNAFTGTAISVSTTGQAIGAEVVNGLGVDSNGVSVTVKTISDSLIPYLGTDGKSLKQNDSYLNIDGTVVIAFNKGLGTEQTKTLNVTYACNPSNKDNADITTSFNAFTGAAISVGTTGQAIGAEVINGLGVDSNGVSVTVKTISDSLIPYVGTDGKSLKQNDSSLNIDGTVVIAFNKGSGTEQTKTLNVTYACDPSNKDNADITASFNAFTGAAISVSTTGQAIGAEVVNGLGVDSSGVSVTVKTISDSLIPYIGTDGKSLKQNDSSLNIDGTVVIAFNKGLGTEQTKTLNVTYACDPSNKDNADITASFNAFTGTAISVSTTGQAIGAEVVNGLGVDSNGVSVTVKTISDSLIPYLGTDGKSLKQNDSSLNIDGTVVIAFNKGSGTEQTKTLNVTYACNPSNKDNADITASFNAFTGTAISVSTTGQAIGAEVVNGLGVDSNGVSVTVKTISDSLIPYLGTDGKSLKQNDSSLNIDGTVVIAFNKGSGTEQTKTLNVTYACNPSNKDNADITASFNAFTGAAISVSTTRQAIGAEVVNGLGVDSNGVAVTIKTISDSLIPYIGTDGKSLKQNDSSLNIEGTVAIAFNKGSGTEQTKTLNVTYACDPSNKDNADITASFNAFTGAAISVSTTGQAIGAEVVNGLGVDSNGVSVTVKTISDSLIPYVGTDGKSLKQNDSSLNIDGTVVIAFNKGLGTEQTKTLNVTYACDPSNKDNADITASFNAFTSAAISVSTTGQAIGAEVVNGLGVDSNGVAVTVKTISDSLIPYLGTDGKSLKQNDSSLNIEGTVAIAFNKGSGTEQTKTLNVTYACDPSNKDNADITASFNAFTGAAISVSTTGQAIGAEVVNGLGVDPNGVSVTVKTISDSLIPYVGTDGKSLKQNDSSLNIDGTVVIAFNKGLGTEQTKTLNVTYACDPSNKDNADITASFNAFTGAAISVSTTGQAIGAEVVNGLGVDSNGVAVTIKTISDSLIPYIGTDGKSLKQNDSSLNIEGTVAIAFNKGSGTEQTKTLNVTYACDPSNKDNADITASFNAFTGAAISVSTTGQAIGAEVVNGLGVDSNGVSVTVKTISDSLIPYIGTDGKSLKQNDSSLNIDGTVVIAFNKGLGTEQTKILNVTYACDPSNKDNADITASFNAFTGAAISVSTTGQAIGAEVVNGLGVDSNGVSVTVKTISDSLIPYIGTDGKSLKQNDSSSNIEGTVVIAFNKGSGTEQTKTLNVTYACNHSNKDDADITTSFNAFTGAAISVSFANQVSHSQVIKGLGVDSNGVSVTIKAISDSLIPYLNTKGKSLKQNNNNFNIEGTIVIAFNKGLGTEQTKTLNVTYTTKPLIPIFGDVNGDGRLDVLDYTLVKAYSLNKITAFPSNVPLFVGDLDGDEKIDVYDCLILKKYLIKGPIIFPVEDPKKAGVLFTGRFDNTDPAGPKFAWTNSSIKARFLGSDVSVKLKSDGENWFNIIIDGTVVDHKKVVGEETLTLASGLPGGVHTVEIVKRTEALIGEAQFLGFDFGNGTLLKTPLPSSRCIEFIGDSIDCGYGNEGKPEMYFHPVNENGYLAYGAVAARALNADQINISYSGKGVIRNCDNTTTNLMPELYLRTLPTDPDSKWNFKNITPQVVVINLGTNDFNGCTPDKEKFIAAYSKLITTVITHYKSAHIYCVYGVINDSDILANYIQTAVVAEKKAFKNSDIRFLKLPTEQPEDGRGENGHPTVKSHDIAGNYLANVIRNDLGWR